MRWVVAAASTVLIGAGAGAWTFWFRDGDASENLAGRPRRPTCATAILPGNRLGVLAWVRDGALNLLDLDHCTHRTLVGNGATPPVRFSFDGEWVGFGDGSVVPMEGGPIRHPAGHLTSWQWSPKEDVLAGVTTDGGVVVGGPDQPTRPLLGKGASDLAFAGDGTQVAVARSRAVAIAPVSGGRAEKLLETSGPVSPAAAGWSRDGRWVLFWALTPGGHGVPLNAAPVVGGGYTNVFDPVLPYADFLSWCGQAVVVSGGGERFPSEGQQILISEPPGWTTRNLSRDFRSSWVSPACSPDGEWVAASATPNGPERPPGYGTSSLWLISRDGEPRVRLAREVHFAYETPRWSSDGRFVMVIRRGLSPTSSGSVQLIRIDRKTGKPVKTIGSIAELGPAPGSRGHTDWTAISDWYRQ
jgi:Tol biopolymer transport system component